METWNIWSHRINRKGLKLRACDWQGRRLNDHKFHVSQCSVPSHEILGRDSVLITTCS